MPGINSLFTALALTGAYAQHVGPSRAPSEQVTQYNLELANGTTVSFCDGRSCNPGVIPLNSYDGPDGFSDFRLVANCTGPDGSTEKEVRPHFFAWQVGEEFRSAEYFQVPNATNVTCQDVEGVSYLGDREPFRSGELALANNVTTTTYRNPVYGDAASARISAATQLVVLANLAALALN